MRILVMTIVAALCTAYLNASAAEGNLAVEDYRVYTVALAYIRKMNQIQSALLIDKTINTEMSNFDESINTLKQDLEGHHASITIDSELIDEIKRVHALINRIDSDTLRAKGFSLVSSRTVDSIFISAQDINTGWMSLRKKYPDTWGIVKVSRVAYSQDGSTALMSASGSRAAGFGWGVYLVLKRINENWEVAAMHPTWIS